jgi:hypothetical protein
MYGKEIHFGDTTIVELPITDEMIARGRERRKSLPENSNNSIMSGGRTEHGLVAEEMVAPYLECIAQNEVIIAGTYDYDFTIKGIRIDLKTKVSDYVPHHDYDVSVAAANVTQDCDYYVFARIFEDYSRGFYLGYKKKSTYYENAEFLRKGEMDYDNMYRVRADCYNMKICKLIN